MRKRLIFLATGLAGGLLASMALANYLTSNGLADFLGTAGGSVSQVKYGPDGLPDSVLGLTVMKDTNVTPAGLTGTISFSTLRVDAGQNPLPENNLHRVRLEIRPAGGVWGTVVEVTAPDPRITLSATQNMYQDSFSTSDLTNGGEYRFSSWASPTSQPNTMLGGFTSGQ